METRSAGDGAVTNSARRTGGGIPISLVAAAAIALVSSGCATKLGDPIPSYPWQARSIKALDEDRCEETAVGADVVDRRLDYISCMIAANWRVYVPLARASGKDRDVANLTVAAKQAQSRTQVREDLSACASQVGGRVGVPTVTFGGVATMSVDPFVEAVRARLPDIDVQRAAAEALPFPDGEFDCALAQLVVHFMIDPVTGLSEMARVTRPTGLVAACVWDHAGGSGPLSLFWRAVHDRDPQARDESGLAGAREGHLAQLFAAAGLHEIESSVLTVRVRFASFDEWWEPFTLGVGPAGDYVARLDPTQRSELRAHCAELLPREAPFDITASAWTACGRA